DLAALAAAELVAASLLIPPVSLRPAGVLQQPSTLAAAIRAGPPGRVSIDYDEPQLTGEASEQFLTASRERLVPLRFLEEGLSAVEGYGFREPWRLTRVLAPEGSGAYRVFGVTQRVRQAAGAPRGPRSSDGWAEVTPVDGAFPPAWLVERATVAPEAEALAALVKTPDRLAHEALVDPGAELDAAPCESPTPTVRRGEEWLEVEVNACAPRLLVLGDSYFPGWRALVDGEEVEVSRADGMLRGVRVPAGPHRVRFTYRPRSVQVGGVGTLLGAIAVAALGMRRRKTT
ncbi:MAG: YfhO family protein, partial [Myxococcaceae bacterium]|nr:YfhO family protein [Myxococcaceae bacterium]